MPTTACPERVHLRLILEVDYARHGVPPADLIAFLRDLADCGAGHGAFTRYTEAEVLEWTARVEGPEPVREDLR